MLIWQSNSLNDLIRYVFPFQILSIGQLKEQIAFKNHTAVKISDSQFYLWDSHSENNWPYLFIWSLSFHVAAIFTLEQEKTEEKYSGNKNLLLTLGDCPQFQLMLFQVNTNIVYTIMFDPFLISYV